MMMMIHYVDSLPLISHKTISKDDHESILHQMIDGNIAEQEAFYVNLYYFFFFKSFK